MCDNKFWMYMHKRWNDASGTFHWPWLRKRNRPNVECHEFCFIFFLLLIFFCSQSAISPNWMHQEYGKKVSSKPKIDMHVLCFNFIYKNHNTCCINYAKIDKTLQMAHWVIYVVFLCFHLDFPQIGGFNWIFHP